MENICVFLNNLPEKGKIKEVKALKATIEEKNTVIEEKDAIIEQKELDLLSSQISGGAPSKELAEGEVVLQVDPEKADQITSEIINGRTCIVIPIEGDEHILVNGEEFED